MSEFVKTALQNVRSKLLDLTRRNKLLNYKESAKSLRIVDELPDEVYKILVLDGKEMEFVPLRDEKPSAQGSLEGINSGSTQNESILVDKNHELPKPNGKIARKHRDTRLQTTFADAVLERRCKKLLQESRTAIEETGSNFLYLAIGFVEWYESVDSSELNRAPLILVPVKIERSRINRESNCYTYIISYTGEDIETNLSLAVKLEHDFNIVLPDLEDELLPEAYFKDVTSSISRRPNWRVAREIVLGLFSFSKLLMYRDLDPDRWPDENRIIDHANITRVLGGRQPVESDGERPYGEEYNIDHAIGNRTAPLILDADSSQSSVIIDAIQNKENLVVEGPPGTGKSQTIANLVAAALHQGMSVLFVAEKKAALEVVRSRLDHAGLGDFSLELHSHKTQKGQLHTDIGRRLKKLFRDASALDNEIKDLARERDRLVAYSNLVSSKVGPSGETIYDIFWVAERCRNEIKNLKQRFSVSNPLSLSRDQIMERVHLLENIGRLRLDLSSEAIQAWQDFQPGILIPGDEKEIHELLASLEEQIDTYRAFVGEQLSGVWPLPLTLDQLRRLRLAKLEVLENLPDDFHQALAHQFITPSNIEALEELDSVINEYRQLMHVADVITHSVEGEVSPRTINPIAESTGELVNMGHGEKSTKDLSHFADQIEYVTTLLRCLSNAVTKTQGCIESTPVTFEDCKRIPELNRVIQAAPFALESQFYPKYTLEESTTAFQDALAASENLGIQMNGHEEFFLFRYLPDRSVIADLAKGLRTYRGSFLAIFSSQYRTMRRTVKGFLVNQKSCNAPDLVERLEGLVDSLDAIEEFRSSEKYRIALGPLFHGIDTDWDKLKSCVNWGNEFSKAVGSQKLAYAMATRMTGVAPVINEAAKTVLEVFDELAPLRDRLDLYDEAKVPETAIRLIAYKKKLDNLLKPLLDYPRLLDIDVSSLAKASKSFRSATNLLAKLDEKRLRRLLGCQYQAMHTDTATILKTAKWVRTLCDLGHLPATLTSWLTTVDTIARRDLAKNVLKENAEFWQQVDFFITALRRFGNLSQESIYCSINHTCNLEEFAKAVALCKENVRYLITWGDYHRSLEHANSLGLDVIAEAIDNGSIDPNECAAIYRHAVYDSMAREIIGLHPELASFTRAEFEGVRERFASLDRKIMKNTRERIAHKAASRNVPPGIGYGPVKNHTDLALIERELQKQKRHIPIRQLVRRAGRALQAIKPCFMMSPLSVAQYLEPGKISFDLVVMDEASQLKPEDALGALARAHQLIVVGDPNQLPPTSFFDRSDTVMEEEEDGAAIQDTESILDICMTTYRKRRLRWHYRSEHESLIAFSNYSFYDNDLIIFPSPMGKNRNYGVHRHYIEGATYLKGRNRMEAEAVALGIVEHFQNNPKNSLGVATFNREQAELIMDVLDRMQKKQPWLEKAIKKTESTEEPFFIKNLENVQGDERDIIFVSTTYGPDSSTKQVYQRFGPIAGETGWRRLNVIFTRAKKRLELFTSLRSADIRLSESPSKGTRALKAYLEYAETGNLPDYGVVGGRDPESDFELSVAYHLHACGFKTVAQVGVAGFFIDIGVLHPEKDGEFILGVECDGASYHSSKSIRDRDRLRQEILEKKGWKIHRIWSTDWFKNRDREVLRLLTAVKRLTENLSSAAKQEIDSQSNFEIKLDALISDIKNPEILVESTQPDEVLEKAEKSLREELVEYRKTNIEPNFPDPTKGILRDEVLNRLVWHMPITKEEFYNAVPMDLRQHTDSKQMQYLDDILEIIDAYA